MANGALDILKRARKLITKGWAKGSFARRPNGSVCSIRDDAATNFCALGACYRAAFDLGDRTAQRYKATAVLDDLAFKVGNVTLEAYNDDSLSKARVLRLFDIAITNLEGNARAKKVKWKPRKTQETAK